MWYALDKSMNREAIQRLESFFVQFHLVQYRKHETILRSYERPSGVFFLKKGYARLYTVSQDGSELTFIIYKPEDFFPITWAITDLPVEYSIDAITPIEAWIAPQHKFQDFIKEQPEILYELTGRIVIRLSGLLQRMEQIVFGNAHAKVASILHICAERFGEKQKDGIVIQVPLTHKDIAFLIGIARETVSVEMKKFEKRGIIGKSGGLLVVKNIKALDKESVITQSLSSPF